MPGYDGSIRIDTSLDSKGFNAGIQRMTTALGNMAAAIGITFGIAAIVNFGRTAVGAASNLASAMVGLRSVLEGTGQSFSGAQAFIDDYIADGLVPATDAIIAYKNLALRGYDTSQIQKTLIALKDASAFGRQASMTMGQAIRSASEGLKNENSILVDNAGVTKNVAKMWQEYARSIGTTADKLTQQQKIQAELNGILEESKYQVGDAAKLSGGYAGQVAALGTSFQNFRVAVGNSIIPIVSRIMPYIKMAVDALTWFAQRVAWVMSLLFGVNVGASVAGMEAVADATNNAADAQENLAGATGKAGKAAKGSLAAFDDLNVLQQDTGGGGGAVPGGLGGLGGLGELGIEPPEDLIPDEFRERIEELKKKVREFVDPHLKTLYFILDRFIKPVGLWIYQNILVPVGGWTATAFINALKWINDRLVELGQWIRENPIAFRNIIVILGSFAAAWLLLTGIAGLWSLGALIAAKVTMAFGAAMAFLTSPIFLAVLAIGVLIAIIALLILNWDYVKEKAGEVWSWIVEQWGKAGAWFKANVTDPIEKAFKTLFDWIPKATDAALFAVREWARSNVNRIIDFLNALLRGIASALNGIINALNSFKIEIPSWVPQFGGQTWGLNLPSVVARQIPRLATGAVIPANSEFLALLGDQRSGRNIETPEALLRQLIREELGQREPIRVEVHFTGSMAELVRQMKPYIDQEGQRVGASLISGGLIR
jgi:hypothetical protein